MNYLENILANVFSGDVGLSASGIREALEMIRVNPDRREMEGIQRNFEEMLKRDGADWIGLLDNENYEVALFESQEDAKEFIIEHVIKPLESR